MDFIKWFILFFAISTQVGAAYLSQQDILINGNFPAVTNPLPVVLSNGTTQITTLPVSLSSLPALATGSNAIGSITNTSFIATQTTGTNLHAVIDSGSITATISGTPNVAVTSLPTEAGTPDLIGSGNITALNGTVTLNTQGRDSVQFLVGGTWVANVDVQGTVNGTTWTTITGYSLQGSPITPISTPNSFVVQCATYQSVRVIATSFTSGTITVSYDASVAASLDNVLSLQGISGQIQNSWWMRIADGTNGPVAVKAANTPAVSSEPALVVINSSTRPKTYSAAVVGLVASATTPTDIFTIYGSSTKTIRITRIALTATQTTAAQRDVLLIKRSTANTGGTSTAVNAVPHDSTSSAATASVKSYTLNPTALGTAVGTLRSRKVYIGTTTGNSDELIIEFGPINAQEIILRGTAEGLAINLNSIASTGNLFDISIEWTEE